MAEARPGQYVTHARKRTANSLILQNTFLIAFGTFRTGLSVSPAVRATVPKTGQTLAVLPLLVPSLTDLGSKEALRSVS